MADAHTESRVQPQGGIPVSSTPLGAVQHAASIHSGQLSLKDSNRKPKLPPGDGILETQPLSSNQSARTRWGRVVRALISPCTVPVRLRGSLFTGPVGSAARHSLTYQQQFLQLHLRPPTQGGKMPNSIHYDSGILVPENSIVACYHCTRHATRGYQ